MKISPLICPVCQSALQPEGRLVCCENGHSFDAAKEGYINLLLSHQRKSKKPGDDAQMIQARRRFFDSGAFNPVIEWIESSSITHAQSTVLDCGCGEGRFLGALSGNRFGVDVSKEAIRCAAKRDKQATWIVANTMRALPFTDHSLDVILSVLAPRNPAEFARVLKPEGALILGVPGANHLIELRSQLQAQAGDFEEKADEAAAKCAQQFSEVRRERLSYERTLSKDQIADLIQMTPIFWNASPEAKARVRQRDALAVTISFAFLFLGVRGIPGSVKLSER